MAGNANSGRYKARIVRQEEAAPRKKSQAERAIEFINKLKHTKGPFALKGFDLRAWQVRIVRKLFTRAKNGKRKYRSCLLMIPRKNGKTELAAALGLYFLLEDGETGAEVICAAADREQAGRLYSVAAQMVRNDVRLYSQIQIVESQKKLYHRTTGSVLMAISAEAYSKHGFNPSVVIYDELHAVGADRRLYDVLVTSQGARDQPLMMVISTAGFDLQHSILGELYKHAVKVLENPALDPTFLPIIFEAPRDADWTSPKVWKACNPALGDFRSREDMEILCARAKEIPAQENTFRRLYLNQWTEQSERWLGMPMWEGCKVAA